MHNLGIIGGGNMGEAIIKSALKRYFVSVSEKDATRQRELLKRYQLKAQNIKDLVRSCELIVLAVKPQDIAEVLIEVKSVITKDRLVISIAAGITTEFIEKKIGNRIRVVRAMPNMPALAGQGITAVCKGSYAVKSDMDIACQIFNHLGKTLVVKEELMDAVTATSGSGPAYVYFFMECLIDAAKALGLSEEVAADLVKTTFAGSVHLLMSGSCDPAQLRSRVTSKGGTTEAALKVFAKKDMAKIIKQALSAAKKRAQALSKT